MVMIARDDARRVAAGRVDFLNRAMQPRIGSQASHGVNSQAYCFRKILHCQRKRLSERGLSVMMP